MACSRVLNRELITTYCYCGPSDKCDDHAFIRRDIHSNIIRTTLGVDGKVVKKDSFGNSFGGLENTSSSSMGKIPS